MTAPWDVSQLLRGLSQAASRMQTGAKRGLNEWGEHVLDEAVRIVPIEEGGGSLAGSGTVAQSQDGRTVGIGFGSGAAAPYALVQHEHLEYHHDPGRQAKYLEVPFQASKAVGMRILSQAVREELGR